MLEHIRKLSLFLILSLSVTQCYSRYYSENEFESKPPARDQFIGSIYFATGSATLSKAAASDLGRMASRMQDRRNTGSRIVLVGYADRKHGSDENSELAQERAQRVAIQLDKHGIELDRLVIDSRSVRLTRPKDAERRVDIYFENGVLRQSNTLYPVLIAFFLLTTFAVAVVIFRRR